MNTSTNPREMSTANKTETEKPCSECATECAECGNEVDHWMEDEEGAPFCMECFTEQGITCDGCAWDDCPQCNEEEETCEHCGGHEEDNALFQGNNGEFTNKWLCRPCVAKDDEKEEA